MIKYLRQIILFLVGFCAYITIEVCFRGYSYLLMGIVGGIILLLIDQINERISWNIDLIVYGIIGSSIATLFEFFIGETVKILHINPMWDYSNLPFNFDGVICLPFSLLWIILSIIGVLIADAINYYVFEELPIPYYKIFGKTVIQYKKKHCKL